MRLVITGFKGGIGRTTTALQLAAHHAARQSVLVNDQDPQCGALAWASLSDETPFAVTRASSPGLFDLEILDMPPSIPVKEQLPTADLYVVVTTLDAASYTVFLRTVALLTEQGKPYLVVVNRYRPTRAEQRRRLEEEPLLVQAIVIRDRAILASYYERGTTVFALEGKRAREAQAEFIALAEAIDSRLKKISRSSTPIRLTKKRVSKATQNKVATPGKGRA